MKPEDWKLLQADGWVSERIYPKSGDGEFDPSKSTKWAREGFNVSIYRKADALSPDHVCGWGPDGLALDLSKSYSWQMVQDALKVCSNCGAVGPTVRVGFAGRVCPACRVILAPRIEYPGWTR